MIMLFCDLYICDISYTCKNPMWYDILIVQHHNVYHVLCLNKYIYIYMNASKILSLPWEQWTRQKYDFGMKPKTTTLHPTCFKIIAMHSICCYSLPVWRRSFLKKGTQWPISAPLWISPWADMAHLMACAGPWALHPYQVSLTWSCMY